MIKIMCEHEESLEVTEEQFNTLMDYGVITMINESEYHLNADMTDLDTYNAVCDLIGVE